MVYRLLVCIGDMWSGMVFFLMMRRPPRSTQSRSSAASDVYKRQLQESELRYAMAQRAGKIGSWDWNITTGDLHWSEPVSYTHLRAHETPEHLVCRLLLEKKKNVKQFITSSSH